MTQKRRSKWPLWVGITLLFALLVLLWLRAKAPPEAARLLPESDAILYANLRPLRALSSQGPATSLDSTVSRSSEFQSFINATGILPERDLDSVAFALHRMADPRGPNGAVAYSEVFVGRFDADRLRRYLQTLAQSTEVYGQQDIYNVATGGRTLRIAVLGYDTVAASNAPSTEQIHSILDRSRASALWLSGSSLLSARFGQVPLLSQAWGIGRIGLPFGEQGIISVMGFSLPVPVDTQFIASLRYGGSVHLRIEEIAPDELAAQRTVESVNNILNVFRGLTSAEGPKNEKDAAMRSVLSSAKIVQIANRVVLTTSASVEAIKLFAAENPPAVHGALREPPPFKVEPITPGVDTALEP